MKFSKDWTLVALVLAVIAAFAYLLIPKNVNVVEKISYDVSRMNSRFTPAESVDVAMAMKMTFHDPPWMLNPPKAPPPLLLYPPSEDDLEKLSGE